MNVFEDLILPFLILLLRLLLNLLPFPDSTLNLKEFSLIEKSAGTKLMLFVSLRFKGLKKSLPSIESLLLSKQLRMERESFVWLQSEDSGLKHSSDIERINFPCSVFSVFITTSLRSIELSKSNCFLRSFEDCSLTSLFTTL